MAREWHVSVQRHGCSGGNDGASRGWHSPIPCTSCGCLALTRRAGRPPPPTPSPSPHQIVSVWANILGGLFRLVSVHMGLNPAATSAPLMTTVVDSSGLVIYFYVAKLTMGT